MTSSNYTRLVAQLRTRNAIPPILSAGIGYAASGNYTLDSAPLLAACASIICMMFAATLQNDMHDMAADNAGKRHAPLNLGQVTMQEIRSWYWLFLIAGAIFAMLTISLPAAALLIGFTLLCWLYNSPPARFSYRPILSIVTLGLILSTLPFLTGTALSNQHVDPLIISLLVAGLFLHRASVSILKDYKDYVEDLRFLKHTFLIAYGAAVTKYTSLFTAATGYVLTFIALISYMDHGSVRNWALASLALAVAGYGIWSRLRLSSKHTDQLNVTRFTSLFAVSIYFEGAVLLCLLTS